MAEFSRGGRKRLYFVRSCAPCVHYGDRIHFPTPLKIRLMQSPAQYSELPADVCTGVGFAIGIDTVRRVVPQLIVTGRVVRPALNIQVVSDPFCYGYMSCVFPGPHSTLHYSMRLYVTCMHAMPGTQQSCCLHRRWPLRLWLGSSGSTGVPSSRQSRQTPRLPKQACCQPGAP